MASPSPIPFALSPCCLRSTCTNALIRPGVVTEVQCLPWSRGQKIRHAVLRGLHPQERAA
jgi:hypothetical protein